MLKTEESSARLKLNGIYKIECSITGFCYYGSASSKTGFASRYRRHSLLLDKGTHHSWILQRDWKRYGAESFSFSIIELCDPQDCKVREQYWLDITNAGNEEFSYNISPTAASSLGTKHSEQFKQNCAIRMKTRIVSEETRRKLSTARLGKKHSEETKSKISNIHKGRKLDPRHVEKVAAANRGRKRGPLTDQIKEKISQSLKGRTAGTPSSETKEKLSKANSKVIYLITSPQGTEFEITGLSQFCRVNNLLVSCMIQVAKGQSTNHKGWKCFYKNNPSPLKTLKKKYRWELRSPSGESYIVDNLNEFCRARNLDAGNMGRVANGVKIQYKGWFCKKVNQK